MYVYNVKEDIFKIFPRFQRGKRISKGSRVGNL